MAKCDSDLTPCCDARIIYMSSNWVYGEEEIRSCENCGLEIEEEMKESGGVVMKKRLIEWMELWVETFFWYLERSTPLFLILITLYFTIHFVLWKIQ